VALIDNLVSYWKLDEVSGDALDAHGSTTLTDHNTVTSGTGIINGARQFTRANAEWLDAADNTDLSTGDVDFFFQAWVNLDSKTAKRIILVKDDDANAEYELAYDSGFDRFYWRVWGGAAFANSSLVYADSFGAIATGAWNLVHCWHDSVNNQIGIAVNAGTADTAAHSVGVYDGAGRFGVGGDAFGSQMDGRIDEVGFWKGRVPGSGERTSLYNGGGALAYPFTVAPPVYPLWALACHKAKKRRARRVAST
jgi:hypothetical protein